MSVNSQVTSTARRTAILAALLVIALATLRPSDADPADLEFCLFCGELGTLDVVLNVGLFIPIGAAVAWRNTRPTRVAQAGLLAALVSLVVELSQLLIVPGRDPSLSDFISNTAGGVLGAALVALVERLHAAGATTWFRFTWSWTLVSAALLVFGAWAVGIHVPNETYYVQWRPIRPGYSPFLGRLSQLSVDGRTLRAGEVVRPETLPARFLAGEVSLTAELIPGDRPARLALIARLSLVPDEFFMIGRQGDAFVVRYATNANRIGLRSPMYALENAFEGAPDAKIPIQVHVRPGSVLLAARSSSKRHRITGARLWAMFLPMDRGFGSLGVLGDVLWLALLFAPAVYGGVRWRRGAKHGFTG